MCTLTVVPLHDGRMRVAFNRDEKPTRPSRPPAHHQVGSHRAIFPTDEPSGGTWLAVNDAGLVLAVLNVTTPSHPSPQGANRSRGTIIPSLIACDSPAAAFEELERSLRFTDFAPFRLVLVGNGVLVEVRWDGRQSMTTTRLLGGTPLLFTSSGLGDHLVEGIRREVFDELFAAPPERWAAVQDDYHHHRWPDRTHLSVNMERATSRTVSHAVITLDDIEAEFRYHPDAPDRPAENHTLCLTLHPIGASPLTN